MTLSDVMSLPWTPHHGTKPFRAPPASGQCFRSLISRIPEEHRRNALRILRKPETSESILSTFVVQSKESSAKYHCICCPNARFQTAQKVKEHLNGQFLIRKYQCSYCPRKVMRSYDLQKHEAICPERGDCSQ
ncbi:hypothetical protein CPB86DRAFT_181053 [Serendipita vermifera]|nr:hypothetical protein CPB86DRAFT_181053 [Serendipita vermifera]